MGQKRQLNLVFPSGGLDRFLSLNKQRPFTSPSLLNVTPKDTIQGRERGGSRQGVGKAYYEDLGSPINLLGQVPVLLEDKRDFWADNFFVGVDGGISGIWVDASWLLPSKMKVPGGTSVAAINAEDGRAGIVRSVLPDFDTSEVYDLQIFVTPFEGEFRGKYAILARMDDTTPVATTDGVVIELDTSGITGAYAGSVTEYASGVPTVTAFSAGTIGAPKAGWLRAEITGSTLKVYWHGGLVATVALGAPAGTRFGLALEASSGECRVDTFLVNYARVTAINTQRNSVISGAGGVAWVEDRIGQMVSITSSVTLGIDYQLMGADRGQKFFVADHGPAKVTGTDLVISGTTVTAASVGDWTTLGIDTDNDVLVIYSATPNTIEGTFGFTGLAAGSATIDTSLASGTSSFRVDPGPKVIDPKAKTMVLWKATAGKGTVPAGNPLIARYRDRIVLAGAEHNPIVWQMSRQGDPFDWLYAGDAEDVQKAVLGTSAEAGDIAEPITALIAFDDDNLVFGARHSLWLLRGDPLFGGQIDNLTEEVGIVDKNAWCRDATGALFFLSRDGLYVMQSVGQGIQSASRERMPRQLRDLDPDLYTVNLEYDVRERGVRIFVSPKAGTAESHFFFDHDAKSFFPQLYLEEHQPLATVSYKGSWSEDSSVLIGGLGGFIMKHHDLFESDDGTEFESKVVYGPFRPGLDEYHDGLLMELIGTLGSASGAVSVEIRVGETFEEAAAITGAPVEEPPFFTAEWSSGLNTKERPRARGGAFTITLKGYTPAGEGPRAWSVERILAVIKRAGRQRTGL